MKTFKSLLIVFVITLITNNLFAQGVYININAGYGFNISSQTLDYYFDLYNHTRDTDSDNYENVYVSLGKGLNFGGTFGYMLNKNIGAELGISYLLGAESKAKQEYSGIKRNHILSSNMLRIIPSLVIASGFNDINPYAKFGLIIGTGSLMYEYDDDDNGDKTIIKTKLNGGLALGLNAGIGAIFYLNDNMSLFGEINMVNLSYAPTKGKITEATLNGTDILSNMKTREKEIEYVDSYNHSFIDPPPDSQPRKELKHKLPFGSLGFNFGLRINL